MVYVYCGKEYERFLPRVISSIKKSEIEKFPIIFLPIIDDEGYILDKLRIRETLRNFSAGEREIYKKYIDGDLPRILKQVSKKFNDLLGNRNILNADGIMTYNCKIRDLCFNNFNEKYNLITPFCFDGFEKKVVPQNRKLFFEVCRYLFNGTMCIPQVYQSFAPQVKNRIIALLSNSASETSWQVYDGNHKLKEPKNNSVKKIYDDINDNIETDIEYSVDKIFTKYLLMPYGFNQYSLILLVIYFISMKGDLIKLYFDGNEITKNDFLGTYFENDKKILDNILKLKFKIVLKTNDEIVEELFESINNNNLVEYAKSYSSELKKVMDDLYLANKYKEKIAISQLVLKDGVRIYESLYSTLKEAEKIYKACKEKFVLLDAVKAAVSININAKPNAKIEDEDRYVFSEEYCVRSKQVYDELVTLIDKKFESHIKNLSCAPSDISKFKTINEQITNIAQK